MKNNLPYNENCIIFMFFIQEEIQDFAKGGRFIIQRNIVKTIYDRKLNLIPFLKIEQFL